MFAYCDQSGRFTSKQFLTIEYELENQYFVLDFIYLRKPFALKKSVSKLSLNVRIYFISAGAFS